MKVTIQVEVEMPDGYEFVSVKELDNKSLTYTIDDNTECYLIDGNYATFYRPLIVNFRKTNNVVNN